VNQEGTLLFAIGARSIGLGELSTRLIVIGKL